MKKCPYCAEEIQEEAIKCRYCSSDLTEQVTKITNATLKKIEEPGGCGCALASFLIPGLGQLIKGEVVKGAVYLIIALVIGIPTFWVGGIIVGIISAADASGSVCKCPKCRGVVDSQATKCKNCGIDFS